MFTASLQCNLLKILNRHVNTYHLIIISLLAIKSRYINILQYVIRGKRPDCQLKMPTEVGLTVVSWYALRIKPCFYTVCNLKKYYVVS